LGERHHVVQLFRSGFKKAADIAGRLTNALLVLDERNTHKTFAALAETGSRRYRDFGLFYKQLRELNAAEHPERFRDRRPGEQGGGRRRYWPAGTAEGIQQHVAPALVGCAHLADAILRAIERRCRRHLDRREGAVVEIRLHAAERRDDALVADRKAHA